MGMYGMGGGMFMGIVWIAFLVLVGFGVYYFFKNKNINKDANETPLDILKRRYARGEITKEEYEQMKVDLR
jgi:putative membrane protein